MSPRTASILRGGLLALLGLVAAVAVGIAAAALTSRQIGLSSEPIRAGEALAPRSPGAFADHRSGGGRGSSSGSATTTVTTTSIPTTTTSVDSDDEEDDDDD